MEQYCYDEWPEPPLITWTMFQQFASLGSAMSAFSAVTGLATKEAQKLERAYTESLLGITPTVSYTDEYATFISDTPEQKKKKGKGLVQGHGPRQGSLYDRRGRRRW